MRVLAGTVAVQKHRRLQLVPILAGEKGGADQLKALLRLRLRHLRLPVRDLPQKRAGVVCTQLGDGALERRDLLALLCRKLHHQAQVGGGVGFEVRLEEVPWTFEATTGVFKRAWNRQRLALVAQVSVEFGSWQQRCVTSLGTGNGTARTRARVEGQSVGRELSLAVLAALHALGAVFGSVDGHATAEDASAALGLAVDGLLVAETGVVFQALTRKLDVAEFAKGSSERAGEGEVIGHHDAGDLGVAVVGAGRGVELACIEMCLKWR